MMNSWLHKDNPFDSFRYKKHINGIRLKSRGGYFEKLISDGMVNNNTKVFVSLQPKEGMQEKLDEEERKELEQYKNSLSLTEKEKIVNETKNLLLFQAQPEDLSVVPSLNLSDIDKKAENIENELMDGIFYVPGDTNGVIYAELSFNLDGISEENYHYLGLLCELIGKLDTEKYGFNEIPTKIDLYTGGISSSCSAYFGTDGNIKRALNIGIKALSRNVNELFDIVEQTVNKMLFDKQDSIKLIIKDRISKLESHLTQNGHMTAVNRALSYSNPAYKFKDETSGIGYLKFLYSLDKNFKDDDIKKIRALAIEVLSQGRLTVGISCDECDFNMAKGIKNIIYERKQSSEEHIYLKSDMVSEGIITSGKIQYVAKSSDYKKVGYNYSGKLLVLKNIIDLEYLWNTVRVQGGAYGCGCNFLRSGSMYMYSYRDPNLKKTLETFNAASEFISNFNADEEAMASYIIGAVNSLDRPLNKEQRLKTALIRHIAGISSEMHQKERDEVLSCTSEDIRAYAPMLKTMADSPYICVIGNGDNIKNDKELFDDIITLK